MSRLGLGRAALLLLSLLGIMSAFSASAFAAGAPTGWGGVSLVGKVPGSMTLKTNVNPNGAETKYKFEYRELGTSTWRSTPEESAGSGTASVAVTNSANGVWPIITTYETRAKATNSYGTWESGIYYKEPATWVLNKEAPSFATFTSHELGTAKIVVPGLSNFTVECTEETSGQLTTAADQAEERDLLAYNIHFTNCKVPGSQPKCTVGSFEVKLAGNFEAKAGYEEVPIMLSQECNFFTGEMPLVLNKPLAAGIAMNSQQVVHPVTVSGQGNVFGYSVNISIASEWGLSGVSMGEKFGGE